MIASEFFQDAPVLGNQYEEDTVLQSYLKRKLPPEMLREIEPGLKSLGQRAVGEITDLGLRAEQQPPRHVPYDAWGKRIDSIEVSEAWKKLDQIAAQEGLVATAYERRHGALSRIHQFVRVYLYGPPSAIYTCPLAMTDGAARALELYGDATLKENALRRLTTSDPSRFWTSGQWMTERTGGSDVSQTSTLARPEGGGYRLYGTKWFTSATTSQMAMTLARIEGAPAGNAGLSLFYLELRDPAGQLQQIRVHRLKDKMGTHALPTAELTLEGTPAQLVGGEGGGVRKISSLFNITRIWNSVCAIGYMRRGIALARDYSRKRSAFGKLLQDHPLHVETLAALQVQFEGCFHLVFRLVELLGKEEVGEATPEESALLRLLTPVAKLYTAKKAVAISSEVLECFGGAGYVEDTGLPRLLRDSQVLAIWEGTTNVLSLDVLRAIQKENAFPAFYRDVEARLERVQTPSLRGSIEKVRVHLAEIAKVAVEMPTQSPEGVQALARSFSMRLAQLSIASLLLESATPAAMRWCEAELSPWQSLSPGHLEESKLLAMGK